MKKAYPKMITCSDGGRRVVQDCLEHEKFTGTKWNEDGTPFENEDPSGPPSLAQVLKAGYEPLAAANIVKHEAMRHARGYPPYGTNVEPKVGDRVSVVGMEDYSNIVSFTEDGCWALLENVSSPVPLDGITVVPLTPFEIKLGENIARMNAEDAAKEAAAAPSATETAPETSPDPVVEPTATAEPAKKKGK